jgi:hypothetical protein
MPRNYVWGIISAVALLHRLRYWLRKALRLLRLRRNAEQVSGTSVLKHLLTNGHLHRKSCGMNLLCNRVAA